MQRTLRRPARYALLAASLLLLTTSAPAQSIVPTFEWVAPVYGPAGTAPLGAATRATAIDDFSNVYTAFTLTGQMVLDGQTQTFNAHQVITKRDASGQLLWHKLLGQMATIRDLRLDAAGNVVAAGTFTSSITIDGMSLWTAGRDYFLAKWTPTGQLLWAWQGQGGTAQTARDVARLAIDARGDIYMTGAASGGAVFGPAPMGVSTVLPSARTSGAIYCAKFNGASGVLQWVQGSDNHGLAASGIGSDGAGTDLGVDAAGNVYLTGWLPESFTWSGGGQIGTIGTAANVFWLKLNADGSFNSGFGANTTASTPPVLEVAPDGRSFLGLTIDDSFVLNGTNVTVPPLAGPQRTLRLMMAALAPNGQPGWTRVISPRAQQYVELNDLTALPTGALYFGGSYSDTLDLGNGVVLAGPTAGSDGLLGSLNQSTGDTRWAEAVATGGPANDAVMNLHVNQAGDLAVAGDFDTDNANFLNVSVSAPGINKLFTGLFRFQHILTPPTNRVNGRFYLDLNQNLQRDSGELPAPAGLLVSTQAAGGTPFSVLDSLGSFVLDLPFGAYVIGLAEPSSYYTSPNGGLPFAFTQVGVPIQNLEVPLWLNGLPRPDVRVALTPYADAAPGLPLRYRLALTNHGTAPTTGGTVGLNFDPHLRYAGSDLPGVAATGQQLNAPAPVLAAGETRQFDVTFQLPANVAAGTVLRCTATATVPNDAVATDNSTAAARPVVTTRPMMSAEVDRTELTRAQADSNTWLTYTVRFRNDGTAAARHTRIVNLLPSHGLKFGSLEVLAASHPVSTFFRADSLGFEMRDANLPPYSQNTMTSMGFVTFRLRVQTGVTPGTSIRLLSKVTLSGQAPATVLAFTRVNAATSVAEETAAPAVDVWPNPARDFLNVTTAGVGPLDLTLLDPLGRVVRTARLPLGAGTVALRGLPAGIYTLRGRGAAVFTRRLSLVTE